jgi:virulence-associated protein VapD
MATVTTRDVRSSPLRPGLPPDFKREGTVYAIAFDLDIELLRVHYGDPYNNAYVEIRRVLEGHGFQWQQGSVYFGGTAVTTATVMVAVIDLTSRLPWFAAAVRDIRMLRIEELNDLMPVVQRVAGMGSQSDE